MASETEICNLALSFLGDDATVSSIDPPEGSDQADHCAQFYPIARDLLHEMATWRHSTTRVVPTQIDYPYNQWQYAYALPNNALKVFAVLPQGATNDYADDLMGVTSYLVQPFIDVNTLALYVPQDFDMEVLADGTQVILTNVQNPVVRHALRITDTSKFPPSVVLAIARLLAAFLAGPLLKGEAGQTASKEQLALFNQVFSQAMTSNATQRQTTLKISPAFITGRQ